ncbi:cytochrome b N-terminal domain-containing protein [Isoptericola sp. b441]|uniref:Cytochrome bc1 complex cytochrome b subunit n=1 Tax=Actinotalea lenta TaxID=3064654 RepID=A0ABT9D5G4_9CELL|nr:MULTISPECIES: cytochrome b N-terminal domain-containing protein [unclassified Isoptericola]MDO8106024.1 cytochrome b N-terminal domain-containing protein [Isoptericola sp. b441]MDO8122257.1 cytochrome b N-terminal domain-containing protein [Isoptericola sp. b490]
MSAHAGAANEGARSAAAPLVAADRTDAAPTSLIGRLRHRLEHDLPYDQLLPETQPSYVASWIYVFGVLTLAALAMIIASGVVLAFEGPSWYHTSGVGHWFNSLHFWSVQLFFMFMLVHLVGKFSMAAWRGHRARTWITGMIAFLVSIIAGLTGYVVQTNFDSQWISFEAKDGLNAAGVGAWFNVANLGQALLVHVFLLPAIILVIVAIHVVLVRLRGVVPPIDAARVEQARDAEEGR